MIDKQLLKRIMQENQEEAEGYQVNPRHYLLENDMNYVLVGVRRAGKSYMLYQKIQQNLKSGRRWKQMLFLNLEDERLGEMQAEDLNLILEAHMERYAERPILFLDEIQNVSGWEKFVRRLADQKYRLYITGSNAKMLSNEIYSTLGGRFVVQEIYPYQFEEICQLNGLGSLSLDALSTIKRAKLVNLFTDYLRDGGFPETASLTSKKNYLISAYQKIYLGDIAARNGITNTLGLKIMLRKLAESVRQPISYNRIAAVTTASGSKISVTSVIKYIEHCENAWLILRITNIAKTLSEREGTPKYYFIDNGILSLLTIEADTALLENLVAIQLIRRFGKNDAVFFYHHNIEVDFYIPEKAWGIQVSYSIRDAETREREVNALIMLNRVLSCEKMTILTFDEEENIQTTAGIIEVIPTWKWLMMEM